MKWMLSIALTAAVLVVSGFKVYHRLSTLPAQEQPQVRSHISSRTLRQDGPTMPLGGREKVVALGRLEPVSRTIAIGSPGNDRLGRLLVTEGQSVEEGEILAYLESYAERLAEKNYAESQLHDAKARLAAEIAYGKASITESEIRIKQLNTLPLLDLQVQEAKVRELKATLEIVQKDFARIEGLRQRGMAAQREVDHQLVQVHNTQEELHSVMAVLAKLRAAYNLDLLMAHAQLETTRANIERTHAALQLESLTQNLALAQARVDRTILRAPVSGKILQIHARPGEALGTQPLLTMGNTHRMFVVAEVYETDMGLVHIGQRARVSSPALPETLTGTVVHIGSMIAKNDILSVNPAAATDLRVVEVRIELDQSEPAARLINLQVDVDISLHQVVGGESKVQRQ